VTSKYGFVTRTLMRRGGHPTDTGRDYDYTDWDEVERFGGELASMMAKARAVRY
jgi:menaquinone-dependent protoporphyrinogen oxidase